MGETAIVEYSKPLNMPVNNQNDMRSLLMAHEAKIIQLLPQWSGTTWERILSTALEAASKNPAILRCTGMSILIAVKTATEFGLSFSHNLGQAYLVPYKNQCTLIIGYRGLMDLIRRAADVKVLDSGVVYEGDEFSYQKGTEPKLYHQPNLGVPHTPDKITHVYSIAYYENNQVHFEVMTKTEVDNIRTRSRASDRGPWSTDYGAMARKTVIRRHSNYLPLSAEKARLLEKAFDHDNETAGLISADTISPEDRRKALEARVQGTPKTPEPKKEPEIIQEAEIIEETETKKEPELDELFDMAPDLERERLKKKYADHPDILKNYISLMVDWINTNHSTKPPVEPKI